MAQRYYIKRFKETENENRESSICWFILPKGIVSQISGGWVEVEPGGKNVSKGHTEWKQIFFFLEGTGKLIFDGKEEIEVESPMVVEIPYDCEHIAVASEDAPLKYLYVNDYSFGKK